MVQHLNHEKIVDIIDQKNILELILNSTTKQQKNIISKLDKKVVSAICIIVLNILKGNIVIKGSKLDNLKKYKNHLRKITKKSTITDKRKLLQKGGFVNTLVPVILSTISILSSIIQK